MIDDPPLLTLNRNFPRPQQSQVDQLNGVATGVVVDCLGGNGAMSASIKVINDDRPSFCGVAVTCCLLYTSPSPRDKRQSRMPSSA